MIDFSPLEVWVKVTPTKQNQLTKTLISRIGPAKTLDHANELIDKDKKAMTNTFSGLFEALGISGREYFIYKVTRELVI